MLKLLRQPGHGLMTFPEAMSSMLRMTSSLPPLLADLARTKSWSGLQTTTQVPSLLRMTPPENRFPAFRTSLSEEQPGESESYCPLRSDPILILYLANRNLYTGSNGANNVFSFLTSDGSVVENFSGDLNLFLQVC